jgi:hypothetical protein
VAAAAGRGSGRLGPAGVERGLPHLPLLQSAGRAALADAMADTQTRQAQDLASRDAEQEATWRERALNAEDVLKAAHAEIVQQRVRIGEIKRP